LPFGSYCQVHEEDGPRNSLAARTQGAISLGPSTNRQGGQLFFSLNTGKVISRRSYTALPMPSNVIDRVNQMAKDQPQLLVFTDKHGNEIDPLEETEPSADTPQEIPGVITDTYEIPGVDTEIKATADDTLTDEDTPIEQQKTNLNSTQSPSDSHKEQAITFEPSEHTIDEYDTPPVSPTTPKTLVKRTKTTNTPTEGTRKSTRVRQAPKTLVPAMKGKSYEYSAAQLHESEHDPKVVELILTQLTLKAAIKLWGNDAKIAAESEMKQLHWRNSFKPVLWKDLSTEQKKTILESHILMKMKQTGEIKGRTVAGGNKQRGYIEKEDATSPTVATESVILTSIIDAEENRDSATIDVPNAFIQTVVEDKNKRVIVRIRGMLVDILVKISPEVYADYVTTDKKGNKQILVECLNAIYGTMVAALLYYQKFTNTLKEGGYTMNNYDPCVWNKTINGKQCTICFHVDNCKISHVSKKVVTDTIEWIRSDYESIFEDGTGKMKINRGKVHKYLGMTLDFTTKGQVKISMNEYIKDIIASWEKAKASNNNGFVKVTRRCKGKKTAAPDDLFKVDESAEKLTPQMSTAFHNIVAKSLYLVKRARPDASVAIAFLTTRVREPNVEDWSKLEHLVEYFKSTIEMPLILGSDSSGVLQWFVDASFAVHPNMRGHTGGGLSMGRGFPIITSTKQKLNTRSSTESELVGVDDMMPSILWTRQFLKEQGYSVKDNVIFQDNKSTMLLERNGKSSSSKRTKHINVRYFFITDRISKGEVRVEWCPTNDMIADFMSKPLQGALFKKFRDLIMGVTPLSEAKTIVTRDKVKETNRKSLAHK
jgi:hypothetical protein